jgi:hypothetical protein
MACKLDRHPNRDELDRQMVNGVSYRSICATFGTTLGTLNRHKQCIKELLNQAMVKGQGERAERGSTLYDRVEKLVGEAEQILAKAKAKDDFRGANGALGAAAKLLDLLGRASGELQSANAGGIHLTQIRVTNTVNNYGDDREIAELVAEATRNFDPTEIARLQALVCNSRSTALVVR